MGAEVRRAGAEVHREGADQEEVQAEPGAEAPRVAPEVVRELGAAPVVEVPEVEAPAGAAEVLAQRAPRVDHEAAVGTIQTI